MDIDQNAVAVMLAKEEIRELVALYSRAADRRDIALVCSLYTEAGVCTSGEFSGGPDELVGHLQNLFSGKMIGPLGYTRHYLLNHLISVDSEDEAYGEVYLIAIYHHLLDDGTASERVNHVRYFDHYRRENGRWRFVTRDAAWEYVEERPIAQLESIDTQDDQSYSLLKSRLFARGARA